jgi:SAM-dependent methyltransferase
MATRASLVLQEAAAARPTFHVVQVRPSGYPHADCLTEFAETVYFGLRRLGLAAFYRDPPERPVRQIVVGAHLLDAQELSQLPADAILYNSEQMQPGSTWLAEAYLQALRRQPVWDYSSENVRRLEALGVRQVRHVPLGYVPELVRIAPQADDIDVLFYGSLNQRRHQILDALTARGLKVLRLTGVYGEERDRAIGRAKLVLSVHYYEAKIFEIVRAAYLFANAKAVVAECGPDTFVEADLREAMHPVPYEGLVEACVALLQDPERRYALAARAQRVFARRREQDILAAALELAPEANAAPRALAAAVAPLPETLHLGSGNDYRSDCFNLDISPASGTDALGDIASPALIGSSVETERFGRVALGEDMFERVLAREVLAYVGDLATAMTNVLRLLKPGGVLEILAPYDLSHGAWQDPRSLRAFNERSWLYYTDRHWHLGWTEARFDLALLQVQMSPLGAELQRAGRTSEEILRTPRAVDALLVRLRKRYLQESERREARRRQPGARA